MQDVEDTISALGNEPPLLADGRGGPPDRREVSARWLSGTFLTGLTSSVLMGVALLAALDGREQLATPPEIARIVTGISNGDAGEAAKTTRLAQPRVAPKARDRRRMEVSMMSRVGDRDVVRTQPFVEVRMALAAGHTTNRPYPPFDPLDVFAEDGAVASAAPAADAGVIYGAKVESEVSLRTVDFPIETAAFDEKSALSAGEIEEVVRAAGADLGEGAVQVAALHYVDPQRFGQSPGDSPIAPSFARVIPENVSTATRASFDISVGFSEDFLPVRTDKKISTVFEEAGYDRAMSRGMAESLEKLLHGPNLKAGSVLRVGIESTRDVNRIVRASVYDGKQHILSIAVDDRDQFVPADEPEQSAEVAAAFDDSPQPVRVRGDLPTVYDGIYRAAYSYGMSRDMTGQLVRLLASEVDFQSRLNPADRIEAIFSQPDEQDRASADSELLYVKASFSGNTRIFYRFQMSDGAVDYFDANGRSVRQFLLRNPVPNGRFTSGFGGRRHPILGYVKMHTGVDWATPYGTPIFASGNGMIEKVGWEGGYGKYIRIKHNNGCEAAYGHLSAYAKGMEPGKRVRQGQVIGFVGSSGMSTGAHVHYEILVNGRFVDPMRIKLPRGRSLEGSMLTSFEKERDRLDGMMSNRGGAGARVSDATGTASVRQVSNR